MSAKAAVARLLPRVGLGFLVLYMSLAFLMDDRYPLYRFTMFATEEPDRFGRLEVVTGEGARWEITDFDCWACPDDFTLTGNDLSEACLTYSAESKVQLWRWMHLRGHAGTCEDGEEVEVVRRIFEHVDDRQKSLDCEVARCVAGSRRSP